MVNLVVISEILPHFITLFENPYMFSLLGLIGLSILIAAGYILCKF